MVEMIERGILLTFDEIRILLYSMGAVTVEGVYMPEKIFSEKDVILAMKHMTEAGYIYVGEEQFRISKEIRSILEIMAVPVHTDIWRPGGEDGPEFFLYFGREHVVVSEQCFRKQDTLKISMFGSEEFEKWREEWVNDYCGD